MTWNRQAAQQGQHQDLVGFIWNIADKLRGAYSKKNRQLLLASLILTLTGLFLVTTSSRGAREKWAQEAFIPCRGAAEIYHDVLLISGYGHPPYLYRYKEGKWVEEAAFIRKGQDISVSHAATRETPLKSCSQFLEDRKNEDRVFFGSATAISEDAVFFVSLGKQADGIGDNTIYTSLFDGEFWSKPVALPPIPGDASDDVGEEMAVDGNVLVSGNRREGIYVYERDSDAQPWQFKTQLQNPETLFPEKRINISGFGSAVAVEDDTIVVGGYGFVSGANVFKRNENTEEWAFEASLSPTGSFQEPTPTEYGTGFGDGVAIGNGIIAVGATTLDYPPNGTVFLYEKDQDGRWQVIDRLKPVGGRSPGASRFFGVYGYGSNISMDAETRTMAVSTYDDRYPMMTVEGGDVFVYAQIPLGPRWYQQALLSRDEEINRDEKYFGAGAVISGNRLAVYGVQEETEGIFIFHRHQTQSSSTAVRSGYR